MTDFSVQGMNVGSHSRLSNDVAGTTEQREKPSPDSERVEPNFEHSPYDERKFQDEKERTQFEKEANALFDSLNTGLAFRFHEKSGEWYVSIENKITHEVIKEVPPKEVMELRAKLKEMIGFFLDKKI